MMTDDYQSLSGSQHRTRQHVMPEGRLKLRGKIGKTYRKAYFAALREGHTRYSAAEQAGVDRETIRRYRSRNPRFAAAEIAHEREGRLARLGKLESALDDAALNGNVAALIFALTNLDPHNWKRRREVTYKPGELDTMLAGLMGRLKAKLAGSPNVIVRPDDIQVNDAPAITEGANGNP